MGSTVRGPKFLRELSRWNSSSFQEMGIHTEVSSLSSLLSLFSSHFCLIFLPLISLIFPSLSPSSSLLTPLFSDLSNFSHHPPSLLSLHISLSHLYHFFSPSLSLLSPTPTGCPSAGQAGHNLMKDSTKCRHFPEMEGPGGSKPREFKGERVHLIKKKKVPLF